ncbi:hypothetical protein P3T76_009487 [Phytophthora citrophthora]|uniref:Uncharacterized protein n=1 Tax=Phytophthora citrophthora TaxID=4793 RepID=A0AAD9GFT9_9STRA|nr:hypothetical protein P3T76_009487 [Phytophthora citrophthora]
MSLQDLTPVNSQRALKTAINTFSRFLASERVTMDFIAASLVGDASGSVFVKLMGRFGVYLAFVEGRGGKPLARNSVMLLPARKELVARYLPKTQGKHRKEAAEDGPYSRAPWPQACRGRDYQEGTCMYEGRPAHTHGRTLLRSLKR